VFAYVLVAALAMTLALAVTPLIRALAVRLGAVDRPGGRHTHAGCVPRLGGVAVLCAVLGALGLACVAGDTVILTLQEQGWHLGWLLAGTVGVLIIGIIDDVWSLAPMVKLGLQCFPGVMALAGGYGIHAITNPLTGGYIEFGPFGSVVTICWVIGITNAFNLIDGLDGLAAGVALIASATLFVISLAEGRLDAALVAVTLAGALAGFLYYNFNPASIFLGDSGSLLLGYGLAVLSIQSLHKGTTAVVIMVPVLALGFPILDTSVAVLRRFLVAGVAAIFRADQEHIHHRLISLGMTHRRAVLLLYGVCVVFSSLAFAAVVLRAVGNAVLVLFVAIATYFAMRKLGYSVKTPQSRPPQRDNLAPGAQRLRGSGAVG
jgi:UDP-GlcNAc:undecaprenyl-phosphate GlcNAc-1-phosphate transferase